MTQIILVAVIIWIISIIFYLLRRYAGLKLCPICVGVSSTWIVMLGGIYLGRLDLEEWKPILLMLMGGSVVGGSYFAEKFLANPDHGLSWKIASIPLGFLVMFSLVERFWSVFFAGVFAGIILLILFFKGRKTKRDAEKISDLEKKLKGCC